MVSSVVSNMWCREMERQSQTLPAFPEGSCIAFSRSAVASGFLTFYEQLMVDLRQINPFQLFQQGELALVDLT